MRIASSCVALAAILIATAPRARAQAAAEAEALFREGKHLMKQGDVAAACEKFDASERLDPEIGTELNLGDCREKNGQTASAWAMFVKAAANARRADDHDREAEAHRRARRLEKQLVYLTISVPGDHAIDGLVVKRNDTPVDRELWDQALPIDPGEYTIRAEAPGRRAWTERVVIESHNRIVEVPELPRAEHHARHRADDAPATVATSDRDRAPEQPRRYRGATIALAVIGVAAIGTATGFAVYSRDLEDQADAACPMTRCPDPHAVDLNKVARLDGWIANIGWGLGGAALAGAAVAWWLGRPDRDRAVAIAPIVSPNVAGLSLGGRF